MSDAAYDYWSGTIDQLYSSEEWQAIMEANGLAPLDLQGEEFQAFVQESVNEITELSKEIGIIQ